jgi:5-methylcytosine-specific restriction endonuclease McrA
MGLTHCLRCHALTRGGSYCTRCRRATTRTTTSRGLGYHHRQRAAQLRDHVICHICGQPGSWNDPRDPLTADHVVPRAKGGHLSVLLPAHRSCNSRRGASIPR